MRFPARQQDPAARYGKSYDANTGMVGAALRPKGLSAVVAQQVVQAAAARRRSAFTATLEYAANSPRVQDPVVAAQGSDVAPGGTATMVTRGAATADVAGVEQVRLFPTDWTFAKGHRVGVLVSGANAEFYIHVPTYTTVQVAGGTVRLPWMRATGRTATAGTGSPRLESYRERAPFQVDPALIAARTDARFSLPR